MMHARLTLIRHEHRALSARLRSIAAHDELLGRGHEYLMFTAIPAIPAYATDLLERGTVDGDYREEADKVLAPVLAFAAQQGWTIRALHGPSGVPRAHPGCAAQARR